MLDYLINVAFCLSTALTVLILLLPSQYVPDSSRRKVTVQILVLGDIGRSPRMQYHAISIAKKDGQVELIGYHGIIKLLFGYYLLMDYTDSDTHPDVSSNPNITIVPLPAHPSVLQTSNKILFLLFAPLKVLFQVLCLWRCLAYRTKPAKWLIVQVVSPRIGMAYSIG